MKNWRVKKMSQKKAEALVKTNKDKQENNRKNIMKAIKRLEKAGDDVTVTNVAKAAGVSRPTVYNCQDAIERINQINGKTETGNSGKSVTQINKELKDKIKELEKERDMLISRLMEKEDENIRLLNRIKGLQQYDLKQK